MIRKILSVGMVSMMFAGVSAAAPVNTKCPVEGEDVAGKKSSSVEVGFCSKKCKEMFDKSPANYLTVVAEAKDGTCPMSHKKVASGLTSTIVVGTCCSDCKETFEASPKKYLAKIK